jgi:dienelactone hydrolase
MHLLLRTGIFVLGLVAGPLVAAPAAYSGEAGPFKVGTLELTWHDAKRDRDVPVKIYYPVAAAAAARPAFPVIIFSHGLGGSREGYGYLGQHWASSGYISVHVQHAGSDGDALRGLRPLQNFKKAASDPANAINRPLDVSFAIDQLTALNADASFPLHGRLDLNKLGVAGHSFGAFTTMAVAGARIPALGTEPRFLDPRVKAAVAMSTPANKNSDTDAAFASVKMPVFHMTGTKDELPGEARGGGDAIVGDTKAAQRLLPYRHTQNAPACLLVFTGGDHMVFSGRLAGSRPTDKAFQALVGAGSVAFWDAWLKGDAAAKKWLEDGGFANVLGQLGTFEHK